MGENAKQAYISFKKSLNWGINHYMASTEIVDIVDEKNNITGSADVATAHDKKLMHRVVGVFVFDKNGNLYLQKGNKYGKLDLSVGGHVHSHILRPTTAESEQSRVGGFFL